MGVQHGKQKFSKISFKYIKISEVPTNKQLKLFEGDLSIRNLINLYCGQNMNQDIFVDQVYQMQQLMPKGAEKRRIRDLKVFDRFSQRNFEVNYEQYAYVHRSKEFEGAIKWLAQNSELIYKIFPEYVDTEINNYGLYRLFFSIDGADKLKQVIIDDFVPIFSKNDRIFYWYSQPTKDSGIWSILIEKALAKILGSYEEIAKLTKKQIISIITGFEIQSYQMNLRDKNFQPITNIKLNQSIYIDTIAYNIRRFQFVILVWFPLCCSSISERLFKNMCVEVIKNGSFMETVKHCEKNVIVIKGSERFLISEQDEILLHLYLHTFTLVSCNSKDCEQHKDPTNLTFNVIFIADQKVSLSIKQGEKRKQCESVKRKAIINLFEPKRFQSYYNFEDYYLRIIKIRHRTFFHIVNNLDEDLLIHFKIKDQYRGKIVFEDENNIEEKKVVLRGKQKLISSRISYVFCHARYEFFGLFYQIKVARK